ncbi:hypothetical protein OHV05_15290 [Kitasatospora sp. NBC_00070]|uniref:hypothetical protein n=1 Tax=Kitasatospora sp. NBC_00070 TaxID=2975962 RepID=UPI003244C138
MSVRQPGPGRGLHLSAAVAAPDVEAVRAVWRAARAAGEPQWYLDLIAAVGRTKAAASTVGVAA